MQQVSQGQTAYFFGDAVKIAPMQTASELMRNLQDYSTKPINPGLKDSVHRLIVNESKKLIAVILEGIEVTDQPIPIKQLTDLIWISTARKAHIAGVRNKQPACIPLHKVFCIGRAFNSNETYTNNTMLSFATPWNLLNYVRAVGSCHPVMLQGDVTGKASSLALNDLGLGLKFFQSPWRTISIASATWWEAEWTSHDNGTWMLGNGGISLISNNQGIESSWPWDRNKISCPQVRVCAVWTKRRGVWTKSGGVWTKSWGVWTKSEGVWTKTRGVWTKKHTHTFAGTIPRVLSQHMLKTMCGDSMDLMSKLKAEGTPNAFRSDPVASIKDWSHFQAFDWRTLMCTQVCRVSGTERKVAPTSHAMVLLVPTQRQLKAILEALVTSERYLSLDEDALLIRGGWQQGYEMEMDESGDEDAGVASMAKKMWHC